jgi:hypothetical protein
MTSYLVGYDLNKADKDYSGLIEAIKALSDTWWHHLDSTWIIKYAGTASTIRDALNPYLDSNDELLVVQLFGEAAWVGFNEKGSKWLKHNL